MAAKYKTARVITPNKGGVPSGSGVGIACSADGIAMLVMSDGSLYPVRAKDGHAQIDDIEVTDLNVAGTTATVVVTVLA
ncbi:hypothetical protein ASF41_22075 [Methylobacterium sp. Leaf111]|jgi:hypothetical protein|uniref:hypothetical protein n=1 Tax=Methylobacterium sp. Leaf111 TaxID=1736257 RepID=UPI0006F3AB6A|nr:hypothetical protein [Methylobacterium sp. Leaf111]KQP64048.1 hypothetical protein ASF41_22075 [Methylobacterium sp. Leaf111]